MKSFKIFDKIKNIFDNIKTVAQVLVQKLKECFDFEWSLPKIKLPHFSITGSFSLNPPSVPHFSLSWYAQGGLPDMGELFVAREAGAELVGKIGSSNAVVNNDQIVAAVSQGVANAVSAVLGSGGGRQEAIEVPLYINGKEFARAIYNDSKAVANDVKLKAFFANQSLSIDATGGIARNQTKVFAIGSNIEIRGPKIGTVEVYDAIGRLITTHNGQGTDRASIAVQQRGLYVVRIANHPYKVIIRN